MHLLTLGRQKLVSCSGFTTLSMSLKYARFQTTRGWTQQSGDCPASILGFPLINETPVLWAAVQLSPQGETAFPFFQDGSTYDILSKK